MLWRAYRYALHTKSDRWQFAIGIAEFYSAGVSLSDLRWLLVSQLVCHAREVCNAPINGRSFVSLKRHYVPADACFILSDRGVKWVKQVAASRENPHLQGQHFFLSPDYFADDVLPTEAHAHPLPVPSWDPQRKELRYQGMVVKVLTRSASNQLLVLAAFQEERWKSRIDDPLPPASQTDSLTRLHDTIKQLNRYQLNKLIRFGGDGTGRGVLWKPVT